MYRNKKSLLVYLFLLSISFPLSADSTAAVAKASSLPLFFIERSKNANTVHYEAHLGKDGGLDVRKPVHAFWINWEKDSTGKDLEELNLMERRMAFGFSVSHKRNSQSCVMKLACCPKRPITVHAGEGTARAETVINAKAAHLKKISVVTREKKTIMPQVISVTVYGTDLATGEAVEETIKPR
jgi:hypothetical protein